MNPIILRRIAFLAAFGCFCVCIGRGPDWLALVLSLTAILANLFLLP